MEMAVDPQFRRVLERNNLTDFQSLWNLDGEQVEEENIKAKSGHSHVLRVQLATEASPISIYVKKQTNYATTFSRLFHRTSSICKREHSNITRWRALGIPTLEAVYCAQVRDPLRGVLITLALEGYISLDEYLLTATATKRQAMLNEVAKLIRHIHDAGWVHRCFFPKHVFVSPDNLSVPAKMIDLEKARRSWFGVRDHVCDLSAFMRRMAWANEQESNQFLDTYFGGPAFTPYRRFYMYLMRQRMAHKKQTASTGSVAYVNRCAERD